MTSTNRNGKVGKGRYYRPQPVDFLLLEHMPEKGMIGGIHWKGKRASDLRQDIIDTGVDPALISMPFITSRLRSMHVEGLVGIFGTASTKQIWARNEKGTAILATRDEVLGGMA